MKKLQQDLENLRETLNRLPADEHHTRARLQQHINDIEQKLDNPDDETDDDDMMAGLKESIAQFETEHPRATAILNDIMVTLSNMGI